MSGKPFHKKSQILSDGGATFILTKQIRNVRGTQRSFKAGPTNSLKKSADLTKAC